MKGFSGPEFLRKKGHWPTKSFHWLFSRTKVYKFWGVAFYHMDLTLDIAVLLAAPFPLTLDITVLLAAPFPPRTKLQYYIFSSGWKWGRQYNEPKHGVGF